MIIDNISKLEARGFKRWTKGNMDRMYISITKLMEVAEKNGIDFCPSRQIRNFGKVWLEVDTGELRTEALTKQNNDDVKTIIEILTDFN